MAPSFDRADEPRWLWIGQAAFWSVYSLGTFLSLLPDLDPGTGPTYLALKFARGGLGLAASLPLLALYRRLLDRGSPLSITTLAGVAACMVLGTAWHLVFRVTAVPALIGLPADVPWQRLPRTVLDYAFVLIAWSGGYLTARSWARARERERRALRAETLAREAQLTALALQLNPHFLFNALNSIRALVHEAPDRADVMITRLAAYLRHALVSSAPDLVPLAREVEVLESYLEIERVRFGETLSVDFDVAEDAAVCTIPAFLIHPLVENAIRHGNRDRDGCLAVRIRARRRNGRLAIVVENTGRLETPETRPRPAVGLANVRERLAHHYPGQGTLRLEEKRERVVASIDLPASEPPS